METTAAQINKLWMFAAQLPADGVVRIAGSTGLQAKHTAATKMHCEQVVVDCGDYCLRRRLVKGVWQRPEQVSHLYWRQ